MTIKDFIADDVFDFAGSTTIWGQEKVVVGVECYGSTLEEMLPKINKLIQFLDGGKEKIVAALIEDDFLSLAEDWASSAEEAEDSTEEHECYIMDDGTKVYLPITEEDFANSLGFDGISVYYDDETEDISASVYLVCNPDYFAYHCIEIFVEGSGEIKVNGLAG